MRILFWLVTALPLVAGELLVLNKEAAEMVFVDDAGKVAGRVPVGAGPHELAVSTDGKLAFAANYGTAQAPGNTISVIDVKARREIRRLDVSPLQRPHGLAFHDGRLYFTAEANKIVARYDPQANRIDWMMGTGQGTSHMVMVSRDGNRLFTANIGGDSVSILERGPNGAWNATAIAVGKGPEGMDLSPDGTQLWAAHSRDGGVSIVDIASRKVVATVDVRTRRSNRLKFTPDGRHVLITDLDAGQLLVLDAVTRAEVKRLSLGKSPEGILIAPGNRAFIAVNGDNTIVELNLDTLSVTRRIEPGDGPDGMAWVD